MDMGKFLKLRQNLIEGYHQLENLSVKLGNENVKNALKTGEKLLMEDNFKLVVVGEFSRGKSTFINAMLGQKVLPAKSDPTTTTINRISYGDSKKFILHYRDKTPDKEIDETDFKSIVAADADDDSTSDLSLDEVSKIAYAEIRYPIEICRDGIEIIDTPGTNDLDQVREEITFKFIPEADAAIFLLSAEQILSGNEVDFLKERIIRNDISKIFFVINFKDRLNNPEVDGARIVQLAERELKKYVKNPRIYLLSSKLALNFRLAKNTAKFKGKLPANFSETGFDVLETELAKYLVEEKSADKIKKYVSRAITLGKDLINQSIRVEESSLGYNSAQLQQKIETFKPQLEKARRESHRVFENLKTRLQVLVQNFTMKYEFGLGRISRTAQSTVNHYDGELREESVAHAIEVAIAPIQQENEMALRNEMTAQLEIEWKTVHQKLQKIFKEEVQTQALVAVKSNVSRSRTVNSSNQSFSLAPVSTDDTSLLGGGLLLGGLVLVANVPFIAIPAAIFGGKHFLSMFENYKRENFLTKVNEQVRERYSAIIPQQVKQFELTLNSQMTNLINNLEDEIDGKISAVESQLDKLLAERSRAETNENARRKELKAFENQINTIQGKLEKLV